MFQGISGKGGRTRKRRRVHASGGGAYDGSGAGQAALVSGQRSFIQTVMMSAQRTAASSISSGVTCVSGVQRMRMRRGPRSISMKRAAASSSSSIGASTWFCRTRAKHLVALLHAFAVEEFADVTAGEGLCEDEAAGADGAFGEHAREEDAAEGLELLAQAAAGMVVAHVGLIDVVGHHAEGGEEEPLLVAVDLVDHGARAARAFDDAGEGRALVAVLDENVDGAAKELDRTVAASGGFRKSVGHVLLRVLVSGSRLNRLWAGFRALYPSGAMREWRRDSGCL